MDEPDQERDLFVSYTQADRAWAEWLAWELEAAGYTTLLQAWDMPAGTAFVHAMDQAVQRTRHTLLVLSPAYLRSAMAEAEWRPGFKADPSGQARRLLPVRVEDCQPTGLLADRVYIDLVGLDETGARARLSEEVASALRGHARPISRPRFPRTVAPTPEVERPRFPTALPPVWNVPLRRNPAFTGREEVLGRLAEELGRGAGTAVTPALQGAGGVGKTALAVEYAYRHRSRFDTVWWVRAEEPATLVSDYADLATALGLPEAGQADQQRAALAVRRWLDGHDRWLMILDNAAAPETATGLEAPLARVVDLLPQVLHGQVLVTSRDLYWEQYATLAELEVFSPDEAVAFLLARSETADEQAAGEIAELLGLLPLALEQAGAYIYEARLSLMAYLERLRRFPALTMARGRPRDRDPADTVATTWQVSLERVRPIPGAVALLEVCAFLGAEEIPRELFSQQLDPPAAALEVLANDPFALDDAIAALRRFGLLKASEQALTVHRLLQQVVREQLDPAIRAARMGVAVRLLDGAFPAEGHEDPGVWPVCAQLLPHALAATTHAEQYAVEPAATGELLDRAAGYLLGRAQYKEARVLRERALAIAETVLGPTHEITGTRLSYLAYLLLRAGEPAAARPLLERSLAIYEAVLPADPGLATTLDNLGVTLRHLGDLAGARTQLERALAIREARLGPDHPDTARSLHNLANILRDQWDLDEAYSMGQRALAIREARLGPDHPDTARSLNILARILHSRGDLSGARGLHERAVEIHETRLGPDHPETAYSTISLARVMHDQGDLGGARALQERALAMREARLGPEHPDTALSLHFLANVLRDQGDLGAARRLHERALAIFEARQGADHPDTARSLDNLGIVLRDQGDLGAARRLHERALAIREACLGADHPDTVRSRRNLAAVVANIERP